MTNFIIGDYSGLTTQVSTLNKAVQVGKEKVIRSALLLALGSTNSHGVTVHLAVALSPSRH